MALLMAIFLGASLSIKLTSVFIFAALALVIVFKARSRKELNGNAGTMLAYGLAALCYLGLSLRRRGICERGERRAARFFLSTCGCGRGTHPAGMLTGQTLFQAMNSQYGGESKSAVDYLHRPVEFFRCGTA